MKKYELAGFGFILISFSQRFDWFQLQIQDLQNWIAIHFLSLSCNQAITSRLAKIFNAIFCSQIDDISCLSIQWQTIGSRYSPGQINGLTGFSWHHTNQGSCRTWNQLFMTCGNSVSPFVLTFLKVFFFCYCNIQPGSCSYWCYGLNFYTYIYFLSIYSTTWIDLIECRYFL